MPWKDFDFERANAKLLEGEQVVKCQLNYGVSMKVGEGGSRRRRGKEGREEWGERG